MSDPQSQIITKRSQQILSFAREGGNGISHSVQSCYVNLYIEPDTVYEPETSKVLKSTLCTRYSPFRCESVSAWEPSPVRYASEDNSRGNFLKETSNIFETLTSDKTDEPEDPLSNINKVAVVTDQPKPAKQIQYLNGLCGFWVLPSSYLQAWLPIYLPSFLASLPTFLNCIINLGASVFLLMADSCARPRSSTGVCTSKAPFSYQFWNVFATVTGIAPLIMLFASEKSLHTDAYRDAYMALEVASLACDASYL